MNTSPEPLMTVDEVAALLRVGRKTLLNRRPLGPLQPAAAPMTGLLMANIDPATTHGRSIALVRHVARGDYAAADALLPAFHPEGSRRADRVAGALAALLLAAVPDGDALLNEWAVAAARDT